MKIENKLAGYFFNHFDFIARFLYSNLHLNRLLKSFYISDFYKIDYKFEELKTIMDSLDLSFENKVCLELGPGNSFISAYNLLLNGAKKVILVDKYPRWVTTGKRKELNYKEVDYLKEKYNLEKVFFLKNGEINSKYIDFIEGDITKIYFEDKIDFVLSFSVLEHIRNIKEVISKFSSLIKNEGLMYHFVDLRDHYNFNNPFLFYKYSDSIWNKYLTKEGTSYTNRLRYDDFMEIFLQNGFAVLCEGKKAYPISKKQNISLSFKNKKLSVLKFGTLSVLLKKTHKS